MDSLELVFNACLETGVKTIQTLKLVEKFLVFVPLAELLGDTFFTEIVFTNKLFTLEIRKPFFTNFTKFEFRELLV